MRRVVRHKLAEDDETDHDARTREVARFIICAALVIVLCVIAFLTERKVDDEAVSDTVAYLEGGFRAVMAIGIAFAAYVGTRAGE
jgi:hypothetical protein